MALLDFLWSHFKSDNDALRKLVERSFTNVESVLGSQSRALTRLESAVSNMPTRADFDAAKQQLQQGITDAATRVSTDLQALRDQIANGNPVTDQDLADIQADVQALSQIDASATP